MDDGYFLGSYIFFGISILTQQYFQFINITISTYRGKGTAFILVFKVCNIE